MRWWNSYRFGMVALTLLAGGCLRGGAAPASPGLGVGGRELAVTSQRGEEGASDVHLQADPRQLVLMVTDLGPGFSEDASHTRSVSDIPAEAGFVGGQQVTYERSGLPSLVGPARIQSWALVFTTADRAQSWFERGDPIQTRGAEAFPVTPTALTQGAKAIKLVEAVKSGPIWQTVEWTTYAISARTHNVVLVVVTTGLSVSADFGETQGYVRLLAERAEALGRVQSGG